MTDAEINEAVARKMGWVKHAFDDNWSRVRPEGAQIHQPPMIDYCHDIKAAWEVVDWMINNGHDFNMSCDQDSFGIAWQYDEFIAEADTVPMAICLAFLKLHGN